MNVSTQVRREVVANLVGYQEPPFVDHFPGNTRGARAIDEAISRVAAARLHAIVIGESGTGKELIAALIHYRREGATRPRFVLDCANPPAVSPGTDVDELDWSTDDPVGRAQEAALFGFKLGFSPTAGQGRRGKLDLATGGTLLLQNIEYLHPAVQRKLQQSLTDRSFQRLGDDKVRSVACQIVASSREDIAKGAAGRGFDRDLHDCLAGEIIHLKPLRSRRQDIPVIAETLLAHVAARAHRQVDGFSRDAMHMLVSYDWPFNIDGLRHVIERAVATCRGTEITQEDVLLDITPFTSKGTIDLLKFGWLRRIAGQRWFPSVLAWLTVPCFVAVMLYTFWGPQEQNLANLVVWAVGWPLLLIATVCTGRSWCSVCPLPPVSHTVGRVTTRIASVPRFVRKYGLWLAIGGVILIVWAEYATGMADHPRATGVLLMCILTAAVGSAVLFGPRAWCRHLCPLGQLVTQYAMASPVKLRSNSHVCLTECSSHECVERGCPMNLHPSSIATSHDCILCLGCLHTCTHDAVHLTVQSPLRIAADPQLGELPRRLLPILLVAILVAIEAADHYLLPRLGFHDDATAGLALASWAGLGCVAAVILVYTAGVVAAAGGLHRAKRAEAVNRAGVVYLPLALGGYFNLHFRTFVDAGDRVLPEAVNLFGLGAWIAPRWLAPNLGTLTALLPLVMIGSVAAALWVLKRVADPDAPVLITYRVQQLLVIGTGTLFLLAF